MTRGGFYQRLAAYVVAAMLTQFVGDAESLRDADTVTAAIFAAKVILSGVIVWRAFIDQSQTNYEKSNLRN